MNLPPKYIFYGVLLFVFGLLCFTTGRKSVRIPENESEAPRVDTLIVRDTVRVSYPVPVKTLQVDTMLVELRDTVRINDTLFVSLPLETRTYKREDFYAEVSGYDPRLTYIEVYPQTRMVTKTVTETQTVRKKTPWGVGVQVGYGITKQGDSFRPGPYVGVGIQYSIIRW